MVTLNVKITYLYRFILVVAAVVYLTWQLIPITYSLYPKDIQELLSFNGVGALAYVGDVLKLSILCMWLISVAGMFFFIGIFRYIFIAIVIVSVLMTLFSGISVASPIDNLVGYTLSLLEGVIITLIFLPPIRDKF